MLYVCTKLKSSPHALSKIEPPEGCNCIQPAYLIFPDTPSSLHTIAGKLQISSSFVLSSVQFIRSVMSNSLQPHGLQHARPPRPSPTPGAYSDSCPLSRWCHPTISPSVVHFCLQSFPASGSFPMSQFFASGGQSIGVSDPASVLPVNIQVWFPVGLTD